MLKLSWLNNTNSYYQHDAENMGLISWVADSCVLCYGGYSYVLHRLSPLLCWFFQVTLRCIWKSKWWEGTSKVSLSCACIAWSGREPPAKLVLVGHQAQSLVCRTRRGWCAPFPLQDLGCQIRLRNVFSCKVGWRRRELLAAVRNLLAQMGMMLCTFNPGRKPQRAA